MACYATMTLAEAAGAAADRVSSEAVKEQRLAVEDYAELARYLLFCRRLLFTRGMGEGQGRVECLSRGGRLLGFGLGVDGYPHIPHQPPEHRPRRHRVSTSGLIWRSGASVWLAPSL